MDSGEKEIAYIPIRPLGKGAFGEAMLYRKVAVSVLYTGNFFILII